MSADNYIYIDCAQKPIEVWCCVASHTMESEKKRSLEGQKNYLVGKAKTFEEAIKIAKKFMQEVEVEYGISFELWAK